MHYKGAQSVNVTASGRLAEGPCWLHYARIAKNGGGYNAALYDGVDANGQLLVNFHSTTQESDDLGPPCPVYCKRGLYVAWTASDNLLVMFELEEPAPCQVTQHQPAPEPTA